MEYTDHVIGEGATLRFYPKWGDFEQQEVDDVIDITTKNECAKFKCFGKDANMWRQQQMFGGDYKFSGVLFKAFDGETPSLVTKAQEFSKSQFPEMDANVTLAVFYKPGYYISPHSDNEGRHHKGAPIIGFSFGEKRVVRIRRKKRKRGEEGYISREFELPHGSAYVMMGEKFQSDYTHAVGKGKDDRLSLTVRNFI